LVFGLRPPVFTYYFRLLIKPAATDIKPITTSIVPFLFTLDKILGWEYTLKYDRVDRVGGVTVGARRRHALGGASNG